MNEQVYIDSPRQSLTDALSFYIKQKLGFPCYCNYENVLKERDSDKPDERTLFLIDCAGVGDLVLRDRIKKDSIAAGSKDYLAIFNVATDISEDIEIEAFVQGYRGVFYENIGLDMFMKGVRAIFDGQVWFSRNALNHFCEKVRENLTGSGIKKDNELTSREKEILILIAAGCPNGEIGDKLCISPHTVKTHIYNLFKKINVSNRFQAALWAVNHRLKM